MPPPLRTRLIGAALSLAIVATAVVLAVVGGSGGGSAAGSTTAIDTTPRIVDPGALEELEASDGRPVYWAGERPPDRLAVKEEPEGSVYLRYLPPGVEAGDPEQRFLTVGTYPVTDAVAALERTAASAGTEVEPGPGGAVVLRNPSSRGSVYLAYPGADIQIEVYDPVPGRSLRLIRSGAIEPVSG
jgi:hypothetical protein